eukprot:TRINITY_DN7964_c0_g1_i1.p1 TRINITY_DN7964_c0_g1~~TRINITY_DN7964_c0_g1_i1.p1  ORF type:complete len:342 (+),score=36.18 TRINITY_DN7964_c0_g1_i1:105-1028(+)
MALAEVAWNDVCLVISLVYLCMDIQYEWEGFSSCKRPIHYWLLGSYTLVVISRLVHMTGKFMSRSDAHDFMLDLRQKNAALRVLMSLTWLGIVPLFTFWTGLGTKWIWDVQTGTPDCLPGGAHLWFLYIWQVLSYLWVVMHGGLGAVAWYLERRLRSAEGDLRQLEDQDLLQRWGQVSQLQGYTSAPGLPGGKGAGLTAAQISELPGLMTIGEDAAGIAGPDTECEDCPICLTELQPGENARQLKMCGHTFHRSCIDLWLYRQANCPLCKGDVKAVDSESSDDSDVQNQSHDFIQGTSLPREVSLVV